MVSFSQWYNEEADIPDLIDGEWVDLETGIPFSAWAKSQGRNENKVRQSISEAGQDYRKYAKALGGKALTGTTKQKEWAEKIRFNILKQLPQASQEMLATHEAFQSSKFWIEMRDISAQRLSDFAVKVFGATKALNTLTRKIEESFKYEASRIYQPLHEKWIAANRSYEQALQGDLDKIDDINVTDLINEANSYTDEIAQAKKVWQANQKNKKIANADRDLEQKRINVLKLTGNEAALDIIEKCRLFLKAKNNMAEAQSMALSAFDSIGDFSSIHNYQSINAANVLSIIDAMIEAMQPTVTSDSMARTLMGKYPAFADKYQSDKNMQQAARYVNAIKAVNSNSNIADIYNLASNIAYQDSYITAVYEFTDFKHNSSGFKPNKNNQDIHDYADNYMPAIEKAVNKHIADKMGISYEDLMLNIEQQKQADIEKRRQEKLDKEAEDKAAANFFKYHFPRAFADKKDDYKAKAKSYLSETVRYAPLDGDAYLIGGIMPRYEYIHRMLASGATFVKSGKTGDFHMTDSPIKYGIGQYEVAYIEYLISNAVAIRAKPFLMADGTPINPAWQSEVGDNTATPASATHKITMGRTNKVKTAKGTKIDTQFALVDGKYLIASHTATGAENPKYPQDLQPRDRKRESSIAWVQKTAKDLDPESLGRTGRADTGAPIVGDDLIVESGNGRTMAIMLAYKEGTADEYRQWLIENADLFGFTEQQVENYKQPVLVRMRKTPVDRATFAVEANQDDKLSFTATERAKSDAKRIDDRLIQLFSPSDDGDLLAASNREFIRGFMASLGDTEAAQYTDSSGKPTQALLTRIKAAIFSKAYDDDRLLEMMADHSKPELQNMLNALSMAAPKFVEARGVSLGDTQELAEKLVDGVEASIDDQVKNAIIDATNMIITAKRNNQSITEFVTQQGLFDDMDDATAQLAVFIATHARSAKKMAEYFKAMAQAIEDEKVKGQTLDMFGEPEPLDLKTILDFANSVVNPDTPATLDNPSPSTDYSPDNPFAPYANDDPEVKQNADDWESRKPLTEQRLADMNALAESMGYVTYIESRHANMGVFQAEKKAGNRHVSIDGRFINNDADSVKETARDFTLEMQENGEPEDYFYTSDLQAALTKGNEWLDDASSKVSQETPSPLQPILDSLNNGADPLSIDLESLGRLAEDEPDSPLLDQIDQQLGKALRAAGVALADKVA